MTEHSTEIAEVAARSVHDYLVGFYCMGEPVPEVASLLDVIEVALFEQITPPGNPDSHEWLGMDR